MSRIRKCALSASTALFTSLAFLTITPIEASAGGFGLREQSASGLGAAFAGVAAGGDVSSMYWNPATMTQFSGKHIALGATGILSNTAFSGVSGTLVTALGLGAPGDNSSPGGVIPNGYFSWQVSDRLWVGISANVPYGLSTTYPRLWAGSAYAQNTNIKSMTLTPSVAFKIADWISLGVGFQAQNFDVSFDAFTGVATGNANIGGKGWGYGWTAGLTLTPGAGTQIGLGYRSGIDQKINGALVGPGTSTGSVNTTLNLPDIASLGIRQRLGERLTVLGTIEWVNWSRIGTASLLQGNGAPATLGGVAITFPFQYRDGWYYSGGIEYVYSPAWTFRSGVGFERSPISDQVRTPRLPDADRLWLSAGLSHHLSKGFVFDVGYSHVWVKDAAMVITSTAQPWFTGTTFSGTAKSYFDMISFGIRYSWDDVPARKPLRAM